MRAHFALEYADVTNVTVRGIELLRRCQSLGHQYFLNPATYKDIDNDANINRRETRRLLFAKYPKLPAATPPTERIKNVLGAVRLGSNDWIDQHMLSALDREAVSFLVTEDLRLVRKARRLELDDRVLSVDEALEILQGFSSNRLPALPAVEMVTCYSIDHNDRILDSLRSDYVGFDEWFTKCRHEHRESWIIRGDTDELAGVCIVKAETQVPNGAKGRVLKLCTFKVSDEHKGQRYGELLLRSVFDYSVSKGFEWLFVTAFPHHERILSFFEDFGFTQRREPNEYGEVILEKPMILGPDIAEFTALNAHKRYGPNYLPERTNWYLVPIQEKFADSLFPETATNASLFGGSQAHGNAIKKAYICNSPTRSIAPGAVLIFYKSGTAKACIATGVVELVGEYRNAQEVAEIVAKRSVYTLREISKLCSTNALVILFRQSLAIQTALSLSELVQTGIVRSAPQSIVHIKAEYIPWISSRIRR